MSDKKENLLFIASINDDKEFYKSLKLIEFIPNTEDRYEEIINNEDIINNNDNEDNDEDDEDMYEVNIIEELGLLIKPFNILDDAISFGKIFGMPFIVIDREGEHLYNSEEIN